jgi:hypothetical protein
MSPSTKAITYSFLCFAAIFIALRFVVLAFTGLTGFWAPLTAAVATTIVCPQFKAIRTPNGEKVFMKWIFMKGVKEVG